MTYVAAQSSAFHFSSRFKVAAVRLTISTGIAGLKPLLDQLVHAVRTTVDIFVLAVNTLLSYVSYLTLIK
jgi:hypothetical protein